MLKFVNITFFIFINIPTFMKIYNLPFTNLFQMFLSFIKPIALHLSGYFANL